MTASGQFCKPPGSTLAEPLARPFSFGSASDPLFRSILDISPTWGLCPKPSESASDSYRCAPGRIVALDPVALGHGEPDHSFDPAPEHGGAFRGAVPDRL
jgi:hypothetical protein